MRPELFAIAFALISIGSAFSQASAHDTDTDVIATALRFEQDGVRIAEEAQRGDTIISMPVAHRRTAVAREPIRFRGGLRNGAAYVEAGAHGYFAGEFSDIAGGAKMPVWCFSNEPESPDANVACIVNSGDSETGWRVAREPSNRYLPITFTLSPRGTPVDAPALDEQAASVCPDLRAEYVLRGRNRIAVDIELRLGGERVFMVGVFRRLNLQSDGTALLETPYGTLRLATNGDRVLITRTEVPPTPETSQSGDSLP